MTRDERLTWIRERGLEYLDQGNTLGAFASVVSDLRKEWDGELEGYMPPGFPAGHDEEATAMRQWIENLR